MITMHAYVRDIVTTGVATVRPDIPTGTVEGIISRDDVSVFRRGDSVFRRGDDDIRREIIQNVVADGPSPIRPFGPFDPGL